MRLLAMCFLIIYLAMLLVCSCLLADAMAASWWRSIHVEWGYQPPIEPAVESFRLYNGEQQVCEFDGADTRTGECDVLISAPTTAFTLTATFADGSESPHSAQFEFTDTVPAPIINTITR